MRGASVLLFCCLFVLACTGGPPAPSPTPIGSPGATPTEQPTAQPTPTVGPTTNTGLPTSILGLPVYTVAGINQLAASGALDGRFAAVAGYWAQYALPCPYIAHQPPLSGFCNGAKFGDTPGSVEIAGGIDGGAPLAVTETSAGHVLWQIPGGPIGPSSQVALVVHAADSRSWQCDPAQRTDCASRLVIDRVAWAAGSEVGLDQPDPNSAPSDLQMTLDEVIAAAAGPGEQVVIAYPLRSTDLNDVDPRFSGQGHGTVWYVRVMTGAPNADATAEGKDVLINDESGEIVATLPLSVDPAFSAARLTLDSQGWEATGDARPHYQLFKDGVIVSESWLDSSATPLALEPGGYTLHAYIATDLAVPTGLPSCDQPLPLIAGDDLGYYADFGGGGCEWKPGTWPF